MPTLPRPVPAGPFAPLPSPLPRNAPPPLPARPALPSLPGMPRPALPLGALPSASRPPVPLGLFPQQATIPSSGAPPGLSGFAGGLLTRVLDVLEDLGDRLDKNTKALEKHEAGRTGESSATRATAPRPASTPGPAAPRVVGGERKGPGVSEAIEFARLLGRALAL
jgi:hypothetical protein